MKRLLFATLCILPLSGMAQTWLGSGSGTGDTYRSGNVGIGNTTTPAAQLHTVTTGAVQFMVERNSSGNQNNWLKIFFTSNPATGISVGGGSVIFQSQNPNSISDMLFMNSATTAAMVIKSSGNVGIGTTSPGYDLEVNGDIYCSGSYLPSDKNLKKDIHPLTGALGILEQLNTYTYYYRTDEFPKLGLSERKQYGFISQEVEAVLPELIKTTAHPEEYDANGNLVQPATEVKAINYIAVIPLLVQGIHEQEAKIVQRDEEIAELKGRIEKLEQLMQVSPVTLGTANLQQNSPNPFSESTTIRYYLPESTGNASITITDLSGMIVKTIPVQQKGNGRVIIAAGELQAGTYTYTLTADGVIINTYKMVLTR